MDDVHIVEIKGLIKEVKTEVKNIKEGIGKDVSELKEELYNKRFGLFIRFERLITQHKLQWGMLSLITFTIIGRLFKWF